MSYSTIIFTTIIPFVLLLFGLGSNILLDPYLSRVQKRLTVIILTLTFSVLVKEIADYFLTVGTPHIKIRQMIGVYGYVILPVIIALFHHYVVSGKKRIPVWTLTAINGILYISDWLLPFEPLTFTINSKNWFIRGPLGFFCHTVGVLMLVNLMFIVIRKYKNNKRLMLFPISGVLLTIGSVFVDLNSIKENFVLSFLTIALIIDCIFHYLWLHMQSVHIYETELIEQQRIKIIVSQIQPHFLYNTIASFRALCKRDPDKAGEVAENFGQYLRQNLDLLESEGLIPIAKEIEHTKVYADIEMVRFENVRVEYDVQDTSFLLPPLTIQPMVENAIRHGVRIRKEGIVRVSTRLVKNCHEIVIEDNGIGFDVDKAEKSDGKQHIGIKNVRERIEKLCGGSFILESKPEEGTAITILIPVTEAKK